MKIIINLKFRTIEIPELNGDCNFVLQSCNLEENQPKYCNVILSILSYINWPIDQLKILDKNSMIDWNIYSSHDIDEPAIKTFVSRIDFNVYLQQLELKYKVLPADANDKIKIFICNNLANQTVLRNHAIANPEFYYNESFLKEFPFAFNTLDINSCVKYINTNGLIDKFIYYIPPTVFDHLIRNIRLTELTLKKIADIFEINALEYNRIWALIFEYQKISFSFIMTGALSNSWSYNTWITIMTFQNLEDYELLKLFETPAGNTIMQIACKYRKLSEEFINDHWNLLDIKTLLLHQSLSYSFVKSNIDKIDLTVLMNNQKLKFKIVEIVDTDEIIDNPTKYVIINEPDNHSSVLFID
jgi:hypothetical protein